MSSLIALLDQDDLWYPHHLEQLIKPFATKARPLGWAYSNLDMIDESGGCVQHAYLDTKPVNQPKRSLANCLSQDMHVLPSASLIAREAFESVGESMSAFLATKMMIYSYEYSARLQQRVSRQAPFQWRFILRRHHTPSGFLSLG